MQPGTKERVEEIPSRSKKQSDGSSVQKMLPENAVKFDEACAVGVGSRTVERVAEGFDSEAISSQDTACTGYVRLCTPRVCRRRLGLTVHPRRFGKLKRRCCQ